MADIHSAAEKNDLAFMRASAVVFAFFPAREAARTARRRVASRRCGGMLQQFHKKGGGDINARDWYATLQSDLPNLAPG